MRRLSLAAALFCFLGAASFAQVCVAQSTIPALGHAQKGRGGQELVRLSAALDLTKAQVEQIKPILKATRAQIVQVFNDTNLTSAQKQTQIAQLRKSEREQVKPILTPAQIEKWKSFVASRKPAA
jgi:Spy/CpxP family protein refolding chaperone